MAYSVLCAVKQLLSHSLYRWYFDVQVTDTFRVYYIWFKTILKCELNSYTFIISIEVLKVIIHHVQQFSSFIFF